MMMKLQPVRIGIVPVAPVNPAVPAQYTYNSNLPDWIVALKDTTMKVFTVPYLWDLYARA